MDSDAVTTDSADPYADVPESVRPPEKNPRWPWILSGVLVVIGIAIAISWPITLPYYTLSPGPVYDTSDFVTVVDGNVSDDGELFFLTVSLKEANVFEWAAAHLDDRVAIRPRENVRPPDVSPEQFRRESLAAMEQSKTDATFVALTTLGYDVTLIGTGVLVIETIPESAADGVLMPNDVIVEMDGQVIAFRSDLFDEMEGLSPGDAIDMLVERPVDDTSVEANDATLELVLGSHPDDPSKPFIGVLLENNEPIVEFPVEVVFDDQNIGGPSAGLMFTLQIIDQLTDGSITKGQRIAGTGTIRRDGTVGAIGGEQSKVYGAIDAGALAVLMPAANYASAVEAAGDDIKVVRVETIDDALAYLESL